MPNEPIYEEDPEEEEEELYLCYACEEQFPAEYYDFDRNICTSCAHHVNLLEDRE